MPNPTGPGLARYLAYLALAGIVLNGLMALANSKYWDVDFNQFYAAGKLAGSGHLYDWDSIRSLELEHSVRAVPFGRIPAFAFAFKPLSAIPYPFARIVWLAAGLGALAGFVALWPASSRAWAAVAVCWSAPAAMCLALGQDSVWFLFFVALGLRLLLRGREFWAGVVLSLCIAKPHLALVLPVFLVAHGKWRSILGGLTGGITGLALSFAVEGREWPSRLLSLTQLPDFDPAPDRMPNLRGLLTFLGVGLALELALALAVIVAVWFLCRRLPLEAAAAVALAAGLLVSHHAYFYDALMLLPALMLPFGGGYPEWLRKWALVLFTPIPYLFLLIDAAWAGHLAITGFTLALLGRMAWHRRPWSLEPPHAPAGLPQ